MDLRVKRDYLPLGGNIGLIWLPWLIFHTRYFYFPKAHKVGWDDWKDPKGLPSGSGSLGIGIGRLLIWMMLLWVNGCGDSHWEGGAFGESHFSEDGIGESGWDSCLQVSTSTKAPWKRVSGLIPLFLPNICLTVGKGDHISSGKTVAK